MASRKQKLRPKHIRAQPEFRQQVVPRVRFVAPPVEEDTCPKCGAWEGATPCAYPEECYYDVANT